jgi:hypothetical protein
MSPDPRDVDAAGASNAILTTGNPSSISKDGMRRAISL